MSADTVFRGGSVVLPGGAVVTADVAVADGSITAIGDPGTLSADTAVDLAGRLLMPGAVDIHVHFRQPGLEAKEDFASGSAAAACGGVTTICDMPNTLPPVTDGERFRSKLALVEGTSHVDFGLWAGGTDLEQIATMRSLGAVGVKVYLNRSHRPDDPYAADLSMPDDDTLRRVLATCADLGLLVAVHVADHDAEARVRAELSATSTTDARLVARSYRAPGVLAGLERVLSAARDTASRVHIAHASLAPVEAIDMVNAAQRQGVQVTAECGPPALLEDELDRLGVYGVPFAFTPEEAAFYWAALADGRIDAVATDHAPHTVADKEVGRQNVWHAPPGYPGVETSLPLMIDAALTGRLSVARVVEVTAAAPARLCGLNAKGAIRPGADADLVVVDPDGSTTIAASRLHSKAGWTPFEGRRLTGRLTATYLRGVLVAQDGDLVSERPSGQFLHPIEQRSPRS